MSEEIEAPFKVSVVGPGIKAEKSVDQPTALAVMQVIMGGPIPQTSVSAPYQHSRAPTVDQRLSLREFFGDVEARSNPAKIVAIGRYLRDQEQKNDFSREDAKANFRLAGEALPKNFARDFQVAIQSGWIAEDPKGPGAFYVTRRGDEAVDNHFRSGASAPRGSRRSSSVAKSEP